MINTQTFVLPSGVFSTSGTKTEPDLATRVSGMEVNEGLPYEYFNYYINMETTNVITTDSAVNAVITELVNVLVAASIAVNPAVHTQVLSAIQWLIQDVATDYFKISNNLSEGTAATIRTNISVYSKAEAMPKVGGTFTGSLTLSMASPSFSFYDTAGTADKRRAFIYIASGITRWLLTTDAGVTIKSLWEYDWSVQGGLKTLAGWHSYAGAESEVMVKEKIIEIGDWNMYVSGGGSGSAIKEITHNLIFANIISISVLIRADSGSNFLYWLTGNSASFPNVDGTMTIGSSFISMIIRVGGVFDNPNFNQTSYNRGFIYIKHLA